MGEDALYLLFAELEKGLEEPTRRPAAAAVLTHFCTTSKLDYQEHVPSLLTVRYAGTSLDVAMPVAEPVCIYACACACACGWCQLVMTVWAAVHLHRMITALRPLGFKSHYSCMWF